ncbi:MAG: acetylglutamate kinase [Armatimonadota bacterium]|nr:acetylglutamate kinase [Armatimonadota bacterium]MDR7439768.1 acetylglutamate kinase [Armatimonadota bacterium]MDR7562271.1 acetylglutamate kinase [Armatimonadota bacterium]MDR7568716.1 acetylglutamate kinase [Armatimonadota bacterium]MDR7602665.1 acetylglutamate kinase [Armatimonadota bacterium]
MNVLPLESPGIGTSLAHALRYVAAWKDRTVVVKFGGSVLNAQELGTLPEDLVLLQRAGVRPVLVHGGGPEITRTLERLGRTTRFVNGLRVTDAETMEVVEMVLAGRVNKHLVTLIHRAGGRAVGLSGKDARLLQVRKHSGEVDLGYVGEVERVDPEILQVLLDAGFLPVIASVGFGPDGQSYNLNADTAAAALAVGLQAQKLILLTDVPGVYREVDGHRELLSELSPEEARQLIASGVISQGMIPKVEACLEALAGGVRSAHIIGTDLPHGLLIELFTETGIGTMIRQAEG